MQAYSTMETESIKKQIEIRASRKKTWEVVFNQNFTQKWYDELSFGAQVESTWEEGSKVLFTDLSGGGLVGKVKVHKPFEQISVQYQGIVSAGDEDYQSESAQEVMGGHETYTFLENTPGLTQLIVELDTPGGTSGTVSSAWERALCKIKILAEES